MYSARKADRVVEFQRACYESIGLKLPKFHEQWTRRIYGIQNNRGTRKYRRALIEVARKSAKSTYVASLCLFHAVADGEPNPRIYIAATQLKQAGIIFDIISQMIAADPFLNRHFVVRDSANRKEAIYYDRNGKKHAVIEALTKGGDKAEGLNPSLICGDELGRWKETHRVLWDSITSGSGARKQPLFLMTSTSADENEGILFEQVSHAKKVLSGEVKDDELFAFVLEADSAKWDQPEEWVRVNPLVAEGFLPVENLQSQYQAGLVSDHEMHKFKRKTLNMWVGSSFAFLNMASWRSQTTTINDVDLVGLPVIASLDLAMKTDFCSLVLMFDQKQSDGNHIYYVRPYFWVPEDGLRQRAAKDGMPYEDWVKKGLLYTSPGKYIDYHLILAKLKELSSTYSIKEVAYDRYRADYLIQDLTQEGYDVSEFDQGIRNMTAPMKELQVLVLDGRLIHGNNPILTWQAAQLIAKEDENLNCKPNKKAKGKIDGIQALLMCLGTFMRHQQRTPSESSLSWFFPDANLKSA